jgi:hypothetical protein
MVQYTHYKIQNSINSRENVWHFGFIYFNIELISVVNEPPATLESGLTCGLVIAVRSYKNELQEESKGRAVF